jgi:outer membrane protein assembly complex protein YaeT
MNHNSEPPVPPSTWAARHKRLLIIAGSLLALVIALALAALFYIRSGKLDATIATQIQTALHEYGIRAEIGKLDITWGIRTARARDIKLYNETTGQLLATIDQAEVVVDIPNAFALRLRREVNFKRLDLTNLQAYIDIDENGNSNFTGIHQPPPSAPSRITFDFSSIVGSVNGGTIHINDRAHQIVGEVNNLQAKAHPLPADGTVQAEINAGPGRLQYEGRDTSLDTFATAFRLGDTGVDLDQFEIHSPLGQATVTGRLNDFSNPQYNFDVKASAALAETTQVFAPDVDLQGAAYFEGRVEGQGKSYQVNGRATTDELTASGTLVRSGTVENIQVQGNGGQITFTTGAIRAETLTAEGTRLNNVTASGLQGEVSDGHTHITTPQVSAGRVGLSDGQIDGLTVQGVSANIAEGRTQVNARQATSQSATVGKNHLANLVIQGITATIQGGRTQAKAQQATIARVTVPDGEINNIALSGVTANVQGKSYQITGDVTVDSGLVSNTQFGATRGQLAIDSNTVALNNFTAALMGGSATGNLTLQTAGNGTSKLAAKVTDIRTSELLSLAKVKDAPLAGTVTGDVNITFPSTNFEAFSGAITAHLTGQTTQTANAIPVSGDVNISAQSGTMNVSQMDISTPASHLTATGRLSQKGDSDLNVSLTSTDARELQTIAMSLPDVEKSIKDYKPQLAGDFNFQGRVTGKLDNPTIEGDVNAASVGIRDEALGSLTGHVLVSPTDIAFQNGTLAVAQGGSVKFSYAAPRAQTATSGKLDATIDNVNAEILATIAGLAKDQKFVSGNLTGEAHLTGLPESPTGTATVNLANGTIAGQQAQTAVANVVFDGRTARLERGEVRLSQGQLVATGTYNLKTNDFQVQGNADNVDLAQLVSSLNVTTDVTGTAKATFQATGNTNDIRELQVELKAEGQNVAINGRDAGQLSLTAHTNPGGRVDIDLTTGIAGKPQPLHASIELRRPGRPLHVEANLTDFDFAPVVAALAPNLAGQLAGAVTGTLRVDGPLVNERDEVTADLLSGALVLNTAALQVQGHTININTPVTVALNGSQVSLTPTTVTGSGLDLHLGGTLGFKEGSGLNFSVTGTANLSELGQVSPDMFLGGTLAIDARVTGTLGDPQLAGEIRLNNISAEGTDLPVTIQQGNGRIALAGNQLRLENFTALSNDGNLTASGTATLEKLQPKQWDFVATANNVDIIYEGVSAVINANLTLKGTPNRQVLGGTVTIPEGEYTTDLNLQSFTTGAAGSSLSLGEFGTGSGTSSGFLGLPPVNLDLHVDAPSSLLIRNQQVNTVASAALTVSGTFNDPNLTGRVSIEGGTIKLRSQRYDITTGTLDFLGGGATPFINVRTEADISGYHVYVGLEGPIDAIEPILSSDPDLPRSDILSLVATGRIDSNTLGSQDLVASGLGAAASLLSETFISQPAQSLLGLNRFAIDPIIKPDANPAARLTLGRQITRDLSFTYSTNLGSEQDQSAILEYTVSNKFSTIASYTQGGTIANGGRTNSDFTIEIRGRKRFAVGYGEDATSKTIPTAALRTKQPHPPADVLLQKPDALKLSDRKLRELLPVETQGFSRALARLGERNLANYLQEKGYFFATVHYHCDPADCSGAEVKLVYDVQPGERYDLDEIRLEGTDIISIADVSDQLQSRKASFVGGVPILRTLPLIGGLARGITSDDRIRTDRNTIRAYLADLGYRSARVTSRLDRKPQSEDTVLVFTVEAGDLSTIEKVRLRGNTVFPTTELRGSVPVKDGEPFSPTNIRNGIKNIKSYYADQGFLESTVQYTLVDTAPNQVELIYSIDEGTRSLIAQVDITGQTKTRANSIRRFLSFKQGDVLTPALIRRTQRDLYATGAFSEVAVHNELIPGDDPNARRVIVDVTETKPLLMVYGLGYSTDEGPRATFQISHNNIFRRVDSISLRTRDSRREQLVQLQYTDLRPFGSPWSFTMSAFYDRNTNLRTVIQRRLVSGGTAPNNGPGFGIRRFVAFMQTERKFTDFTSVRFRYTLEQTRVFNTQNIPIEEIGRNDRPIRLGSFTAGFSNDTRDSVLNPTHGQLISFDHTIATRFLGGSESFNKLFVNYQHYTQLPTTTPVLKNSVLTFAARIGLAKPFNIRGTGTNGEITELDRLLPISQRFFSGGATTLRGFRYEQAGPQAILEPRNAQELPTLVAIGGDALVVLNFELRYPLTKQLRLVPFYDLGNVFRRVSDINFGGMTHTVGLGLRLNTPIGPVGIDYGYLLDPPTFRSASGMIIRQPQGVIHIRFGQSF